MKNEQTDIATFHDFWVFYLGEHNNPINRGMHFVGTALTFVFYFLAIYKQNALYLIGAPLIGYGFAWLGHLIFEKNRPATFRYPLYSLVADYKMFFLMLTGRLQSNRGSSNADCS